MLDGSGSKPQALYLLRRSWMEFVVKMIHYRAGLVRFLWAVCNCFSQHSCTKSKKSCWNRWTQPNLALASKIQNNGVWRTKNKEINLCHQLQCHHLSLTYKKCDKDVLVYVILMCHGDRTRPGNMMDSQSVPDPYCIHMHINRFHKPPPLMPYFKGSDRGLSQSFSILCSGYKSCVCRQLRRPDGMRIICFINGGLEPRLHGVKGACKQLNVGNSKVVFDTGTKDKLVWTLVKQANNTTHLLV